MIIREMRLADAEGVGRVHANSWQVTYRGMVPDDYLDSIKVEEWQERWRSNLSQPDTSRFGYVAEDPASGTIVGFVRGGTTRYPNLPYQGELYAIYLLKEYQQHGLGRRLVQALVRDLVKSGLSDMLLWVLEANTASRRFYEKLGGTFVKTNTFEIAGVSLNECAYGWSDLSQLVQDKQA